MNSLRVRAVLAIVAWLVVTLACSPVLAQSGPRVEFDGMVQWIAANRLTLIVHDGPAAMPVVAVNLTRVPLDQYQTIRPGDPVAVVGVVSDDDRELIADSIIRLREQQAP